MDPDEKNSSQVGEDISSASSSLTMITQPSNTSSQPNDLPKIPSGISITPTSQEAKSSFAHPPPKMSENESRMPPPPISIKLSQLQKNASEAVGEDEEGDDDDSEEESESEEEDDDGVEEVGMDDSDDDEGDDDAEVCV